VAVPEPASLRGLAAVSAAVAYVGGSGGALWRTDDAGMTWIDEAPADAGDCDFRDLAVLDDGSVLALVAGTPARVYRSEDRGQTWRVVLADPRDGAFFDALACRGTEGAMFADPLAGAFGLWTTADGGRQWQPVPTTDLPPPLPGEAAFAASGGCVLLDAAADGRILVATGGGARARVLLGSTAGRWQAVDTPLAAGSPSRGGFGLARCGAALVLVGGDYQAPLRSEGTAAVSRDGGLTWQPCPGGAGGFRSAVVALDGRTALAVGSHGCSWSTDGGASWQWFAGPGWHAIERAQDGAVWCCGSDGRVARVHRVP
jgi:photosystem II stability/assembly factor-like uncharacterized protein